MLHDSAGAQSALVQRATCGLQPALKVDGGGGGSQSGARGPRRSRPRPLDEDILEEQVLDTGAEESLERLARRVDDRLAFHVEARIQYHLATRGPAHRPQQLVECR